MFGNRVPVTTHGYKPFAAHIGYKGVNSLSGGFSRFLPGEGRKGVSWRDAIQGTLVTARGGR